MSVTAGLLSHLPSMVSLLDQAFWSASACSKPNADRTDQGLEGRDPRCTIVVSLNRFTRSLSPRTIEIIGLDGVGARRQAPAEGVPPPQAPDW